MAEQHPERLRQAINSDFTAGVWIQFSPDQPPCGCFVGTIALQAGFDAVGWLREEERLLGSSSATKQRTEWAVAVRRSSMAVPRYVAQILGQDEQETIAAGYQVTDIAGRLDSPEVAIALIRRAAERALARRAMEQVIAETEAVAVS
jgi:hypothetical protein